MYGDDNNFGDIREIDRLPDGIDLLTHTPPCQDFAIGGRHLGGEEGSGTRSSLMWESVRLISDAKPKVVIWENVANATRGRHTDNFYAYLDTMEDLGYVNSWEIINPRDIGMPQNRPRVFVVSILDGEEVDLWFNVRRMKPITDFIDFESEDVVEVNVTQAVKKGYTSFHTPAVVNLAYPSSKTRRGRVIDDGKVCPTLQTKNEIYVVEKGNMVDKKHYSCYNLISSEEELSMRPLKTLEVFRLMGFDSVGDTEMNEARLVKMAGNSICVPVLEKIIGRLYEGRYFKD